MISVVPISYPSFGMWFKIGTLSALFFSSTLLFCQQRVSGKVMDDESAEPLPFCHGISSDGVGFITDVRGEFDFEIHSDLVQSDSITFSYVGFKSKAIAITDLFGGGFLEVRLEPMPINLDDVIVRGDLIRGIDDWMMDVVAQYNEEKRKLPHLAFGHFLESANSADEGCILRNESLGFGVFMGESSEWSPLGLYKFVCTNSKIADQSSDWSRLMTPGATQGIGGSITLNAFRHFEIEGLLSRDKVKSYKFKLDSTFLDGKVYKSSISFKSGKEAGTLVVDSDNRIYRIEARVKKRIWSIPLNKRVDGDMLLTFRYFEGVPFVSHISVRYMLDRTEYNNRYMVILQRFKNFDISKVGIGAVNNLDKFPYIIYDQAEWKRYDKILKSEDFSCSPLGSTRSLLEQFGRNSGRFFGKKQVDEEELERYRSKIALLQSYF